MDELDLAMLSAWHALTPATQRARIALRDTLPRLTARPFCLSLRASDTRLPLLECVTLADPHAPSPAHSTLLVTLDADDLRDVTAPVLLPWPGVDWTTAAAKLGRHPESLRNWIRAGHLQSRHQNAYSLGKRGKPVPIVWSASPLSPGANHAKPPNPVWGSLWCYLHTRIPPNFSATLRLAPSMRPYPGGSSTQLRLRGRTAQCPTCNRRTQRLYLPIQVKTLADHLGICASANAKCPRPNAAPPPSLACHRCHRIRYFDFSRSSWNEIIRCLSGNLLFGREVPRPQALPILRQRTYRRHQSRPTPARDQVLAILQQYPHAKSADLARRAGLRLGTFNAHLSQLYRLHHVHKRRDLLLKLRFQPATAAPQSQLKPINPPAHHPAL